MQNRARQFVRDVRRRLPAVGDEIFLPRGFQTYGTFRLEFVADTATAVTGPLPT